MGVCTSDPLTYLIKEYGEDVCKYIVAWKSEDFIDETAPKLSQRVQEGFKKTAGTLDQEFNSKEATIKGKFDTVIADVKQNNAEALESAKKSQNKTEDELFGLNSIQSQIEKLKSTKDQKLKDQQDNILRILTDKKDSLKKSIQESKPSLPLFDNMPVCLRQKVLSDGEEKFAPQIKSKQEEILSMFEKVTNVGNLEAEIKKAVGLNEVDRMVSDSDSMFEKAKKAITGFSALSGFGGKKGGRSCFG